ASGAPPRVHCKRCNGELSLKNADRALQFLKSQLTGTSRAPAPPAPIAETVPVSLGAVSIPPRVELALPPQPRSHATAYAIGALTVAVLGLAGAQFVKSQAPAAATASAVSAKESPSASASA